MTNDSFLHTKVVQDYLNLIRVSLKKLDFMEEGNISKLNFISILTLEALGITEPSQAQIDVIEALIFFIKDSEFLTCKNHLTTYVSKDIIINY